MKLFSVVIPFYKDENNYNEFFDKNYKVIKECSAESEIIIVDDTGNESFITEIPEKYPDVKIIRHSKNEGFSKSANDGILSASNDIVFLFNSDITLTNSAMEKVLPHFEDTTVFAITLMSLHPDGRIREGAKNLVWKSGIPLIKHSPKDYPEPDEHNRIPSIYAVGGHAAFRKSIFTELNGFDEITFGRFYYEDTDLGFRALKKGYKIFYEPAAEVIHPQESSTIKNNYDTSFIKNIRFRNRVFFALKNFDSFFNHLRIRSGLILRFAEMYFKTWKFRSSYEKTIGLVYQYKLLKNH